MSNRIHHLPLAKLVPHPDHPNRMSQRSLDRLTHNIDRTGCYEPLVVRPCPKRPGFFQIIHGHQRCEALRQLGHRTADALIWDLGDTETDILLATLNRLNGRDRLDKKLVVLRRLRAEMPASELAKFLPQTPGQLDRLTSTRPLTPMAKNTTAAFAIPLVFFVDEGQQRMIEDALSRSAGATRASTRAARRAAALAQMAGHFLHRRATGKSGPSDP